MAGKKKKKTKPRGKKALQKRINKIVIAVVVIIVAVFSVTAVLWGKRHYENGFDETAEESAAEDKDGQDTGAGPEGKEPVRSSGGKEERNAEEIRLLKHSIAARRMYRQGKGSLVIIIDDVGYNLYQLKPFLDFPGPIVFAIIPNLPYSEKAAELISEHGKEYIIHQPMEAVSRQDLGPQAILSGMKAPDVELVLGENVKSLPGAVGMNNHMGSKVTADPNIMSAVVGYLERKGLLFIDSLTTPHSAVKKVIEHTRLPYIRRDVFLDNRETIGYYTESFSLGKERAEQAGYAVLIGHVQSEGLAEMLKQSYAATVAEGYTFVPVSKLPFVIESYAGIGY